MRFDDKLTRFGIVGSANTALGLLVIFAARQYTDDITANLIGYVVMVPLTFYCHRRVTFRDRGHPLRSFLRYIGSILIGYISNRIVLGSALALSVNAYVAQALSIAAHVVVIYVLSTIFVFNQPVREQH